MVTHFGISAHTTNFLTITIQIFQKEMQNKLRRKKTKKHLEILTVLTQTIDNNILEIQKKEFVHILTNTFVIMEGLWAEECDMRGVLSSSAL